MASTYYLTSSLPMLRYGEPVPFSTEEFLSLCAPWISGQEADELRSIGLGPEHEFPHAPDSIAVRWYTWETSLRNRLVRQRAAAIDRDPQPLLHDEADWFSEIDRAVQDAFATANPLERERVLDRIRWRKLDDLEAGHHFDFEQLCVYKIKLMLNEKWQGREKEAGKVHLDQAVAGIVSEKTLTPETATAS